MMYIKVLLIIKKKLKKISYYDIIENLNKKLAQLTKDTEDKKSTYFDNSEIAKVIKN